MPLIVLLLVLFSLTIPFLDVGWTSYSLAALPKMMSFAVLTVRDAPMRAVVGTWLLEAFGLIGIFLLVEGRSRLWWLDALLASWAAWIFRGPLLVVTLGLAAGRPRVPLFHLVVGWWVLYSVCGLALGILVRAQAAAAARAERAAEAAAIEAERIEAAEARVARAGPEESGEPVESEETDSTGELAEQTGAETRKFELPSGARDPLEET